MDSRQLLKTPLHDWHQSRHATMAAFGGYHMPLWYQGGAKQEHRAVLCSAGLFDTSHMSVLSISGEDAESLVQHCFTRDLRRCVGSPPGQLTTGRCVYGLLLREDGTVLDDAVVTMLGVQRYLLVVNSGMGAPVCDHLRGQSGYRAEIVDHTGMLGKIDLQGPASALVLEAVLAEPDRVLNDMIYFSCKGDIRAGSGASVVLQDSTSVLLSRTGYTGEFGFELFVPLEATVSVWELLLSAGAQWGVVPCGLAARDSLRSGAMLPLSHQDIGDWPFANTPWSFVLPWHGSTAGFSKRFVGDQALLGGETHSYTYAFAGYDPRKIPVSETTAVFDESGERFGVVLTCTTDMGIDRVGDQIVSLATSQGAGRPADFQPRGLCCGFIRVTRRCSVGEQVLLTDGKRRLAVEIRQDVRPDRTARRSMREMRKPLRGECRHEGDR